MLSPVQSVLSAVSFGHKMDEGVGVMLLEQKVSRRGAGLGRRIWDARVIYCMLIPGLVWFGTFVYKPIYGLLMAFEKFNIRKGILGSPWVGLSNFERLFASAAATRAIMTTLEISLTRLCVEFCFPILLAILLNEMRGTKLKRVYQTIFTFPHFLSWVVVGVVVTTMLKQEGLVNALIVALGGQASPFLSSKQLFRPLLYFTSIWKGAGWSAIIYMAAITGINPELYEAAAVDGAGRIRRIWHITLPGIMPTIIIMLILAIGGLMNGSFDQIFNLQNAIVKSVATTIDIYVYDITFDSVPDYGFSTAVGLFKSLINVALLVSANTIVKKVSGSGLFA